MHDSSLFAFGFHLRYKSLKSQIDLNILNKIYLLECCTKHKLCKPADRDRKVTIKRQQISRFLSMAYFNKFYYLFAVILAIFCILVVTADAFSVDLFENKHFKGRSTTLDVKQGCVDIPVEWDDEISSIQPAECVIIYKHPKCQGPRVRLEPWTFGTAHLQEINFEDKLSSVSACKFQSPLREREEF